MSEEDWISEEWLRGVGFKWHTHDERSGKHWLLWLGDALVDADGRPRMFCDFEEIGIELAAATDGEWFCWFRSDVAGRYHRFIHVRYFRRRSDLIRLIEAITGQDWNPQNHSYGMVRTPKDAEALRKHLERADLHHRLNGHPWSECEKDDSMGRPLPEHQEKAEFGK